MKFSPLNRTTAPQILRLCMLCFKNGVLDAYEQGDDYAVQDFLDKHKKSWTYGVLGEPDDYDWKMWRFTLYKWCRRNNLTTFAENYLYDVKRYNYLYCPILLSMRFYLMGIEEWLAYPNPVNIERFRSESAIHWQPLGTGAQKITRREIIAQMQDFAYQFHRRPVDEREISYGVLDEFCSALFDLTSKLKYKKRIIVNGKAIQNIKASPCRTE